MYFFYNMFSCFAMCNGQGIFKESAMIAILGSIAGALVGAFVSWLINRKRPHYIFCEEEYKAHYDWQGVPETKIMLRDTPFAVLGLLDLRFRNMGSMAIESPKITVRLNEKAQIVNAISKITPERVELKKSESEQTEENLPAKRTPVSIAINKNSVDLSIDYLIPFNTNRETVAVEVFTDGKIENVQILGNGVLRDGSAWAVLYKSKEKVYAKKYKIVTLISVSSLLILLVLVVVNIYLYIPQILSTSGVQTVLNQWIVDPLFWVLAGWLMVTLGGHLYLGWKGTYMNIPVPFTTKELVIGFWRRRK